MNSNNGKKWSSAYSAANHYAVQSRTCLEKLEGIRKRLLMRARPEKWLLEELDAIHGRAQNIHSELARLREEINR